MNFLTKLSAVIAFVLGTGFSAATVAAENCPPTITLPAATVTNSVTFGDGISYSLPILGLTVQSSPGQIQDCIVVATGASGNPVNTNFAGMDNAYQTPSGTSTGPSASPYFRTGDSTFGPDPGQVGGAFVGDAPTTWDTRLTALSSFLAGNDMVVYFNHNQVNSGASTNQDLFVWAQIRLVDDDNLLPTRYFYVTAMINPIQDNFGIPGFDPTLWTGPQSADPLCIYPTGPTTGLNNCPNGLVGSPAGFFDADYMVRARGQICLNGPVGSGTPVPCDGSGGPVVATVNENLGADRVANAVVFPEINAILRVAGFNGYESLSADIRMGCNNAVTAGGCKPGEVLNNGYEQIFIGRLAQVVPEPSSLALLGLGLLAAAGLGRRRRRTH